MLNSVIIHLSQQVICFIYTDNLALYKPTWETFPWPDKGRDFGSENAVDGLYDNRGDGGQCTISDGGKYNATWRVDLGGVVSISYINIYYRKDSQSTYLQKKLQKLNSIDTYTQAFMSWIKDNIIDNEDNMHQMNNPVSAKQKLYGNLAES